MFKNIICGFEGETRKQMKTVKILSIGNSFSEDAQSYLHKISVLNEIPVKSVNLYIGGCSLRRHYFNMLEDRKAYDFQFNGESTGLSVNIKDALMSDEWDFVTLQQASIKSVDFETYQPYLTALCEYVNKYAPTAKLVIHQTWAYDEALVLQRAVAENQKQMLDNLRAAYKKAAKAINAYSVIPSGEAVDMLGKNKIFTPYRDGYHLSIGSGRLTLGLLWYCFFTGAIPESVVIPEIPAPVSEEEIIEIRKIVASLI